MKDFSDSDYYRKVTEWENQYGKPLVKSFEPTSVRVCCARCGSLRQRTSRHHKGSMFLLALYFPHYFAARYIQFSQEDCVRLCQSTCHKNAEKYVLPIKDAFASWARLNPGATLEQVELWHQRFTGACDKWLRTPYRKKRKKRVQALSHGDFNLTKVPTWNSHRKRKN